MAVIINGDTGVTTPGISNSEGYTGDGLTIAAGAPSGAMTLDASGNLGIGTSSPQLKLVASNGGVEEIALSPTGGVNSGTYIQSYNRNTSSYLHNTNFASSHTWYSGATRAVDIDSSGNLLVGTTATRPDYTTSGNGINISSTGKIFVGQQGDNALSVGRNTSTGAYVNWFYGTTGTGSITTNGTTTAYNTSSDYRLKENIQPMTGALAKVQALKPCTYNWKVDGSDGEGFIAHELAEVVPQCVTGEKDAVEVVDVKDEDGNVIGTEERPVYQGIDTSFLIATLTAAIQEQQALIESLTARVVALEGAQIV